MESILSRAAPDDICEGLTAGWEGRRRPSRSVPTRPDRDGGLRRCVLLAVFDGVDEGGRFEPRERSRALHTVFTPFRWLLALLHAAARAARVQARSEIYLFAALPFKLDASTDRRTPTAWIRHAMPMETDADSDGGRPNNPGAN